MKSSSPESLGGRDRSQAEGQVHRLLENAHDMVYRFRFYPTVGVDYMSGGSQAITGRTPAEMYADPSLAQKSVHPDDAHLIVQTAEAASMMETAITLRWVHPDGHVVWAEHRRVPIFDESGKLVAIEGIARDVTERVESQRRLRESEDQMRQLAMRVQTMREEERNALARELHDDLGQTLTAIKLEIARAVDLFRTERLSAAAVDRLQSLVGLTEIGIATVKRISTSLRPATLDHLGLAEAIRWEATAFRARTGIRCRVTATRDTSRLAAEQETMLFRIFQESLTNVVRHAHASAVQVRMVERRDLFELWVHDNGRGISEEEARDPRAIGLLGMRERAAIIGGAFQIDGRRGKGTTVRVHVPLAATPPRARRARPGKA
jgi:PAS domain S-box-containing protein